MSRHRHESELDTLMAPSLEQPMSLTPVVEMTTPVFGTRYEVLSLLGTGGMGTVYKARDRELDEIVALKVLRPEVVATPGALDMFKREVKLARRVTHPNVARTFDIGEADGSKYLTMEYIEGTSLARVLDWCGPFDLSRAVDVTSQICAGLAAAHAVGVVHRDLKPENVLVRKTGALVLTDFGIARPVEEGSPTETAGIPIGTPAYMAPEQVEARRDLDGRADLYALGVVLYELLTGELPFDGHTALAVASARLVKPPPDPRVLRNNLPDAVAEVVLRCMARDRDKRFSKAEDVLQALARMTAPIATPAAAPVSRSAQPDSAASKMVAVLPFRNGGGSDDAFTADGLLEELIDGLSMTPGLRVRPRGSVARFAGVDRDPCEVGQELGVDVVVEGSVRRQGDQVRVAARLFSVTDGFQLWARRFERSSADLFALSDEMAGAVAAALTMQRVVPTRDAPVDPVAMDLYLKARVELRSAWAGMSEVAISLFEQALQLSPDDPTFLAGYTMAQIRAWFFGRPDAEAKARFAAEKALALAPHLVEARYAVALFKLHGRDVMGAIADLKTIVERSEYAPAYETLGTMLYEVGLATEARKQIERALQIDPESIFGHFEMAKQFALEGDWQKVDFTLDRLASIKTVRTEGNGLRARFAMWRGVADPAFYARLGNALGPVPISILVELAGGSGDRQRIESIFREAAGSGSARRGALLHQIEAEIAGYLRDPEWGIAALHRSIDAGLVDIVWLRVCPILAGAREHDGYAEIDRIVSARADEIVAIYRRR